MSGASNTAGMVGRFGSTSYTSISTLGQRDPRFPPKYPKPSKFFKSRNLKDSENVIEEVIEADEEEEDATTSANSTTLNSTENSVLLGTHSANSSCSSVNSTVVENLRTPLAAKKKSSNISVAVRSRPILQRELDKVPPEGSILDITEDQVIVALKKPFRFDKIFDENSSQEQVYHSLIRPMVDKVLCDYNASVFAYGQTGTGKTFTMGTNDQTASINDPSIGVIPRAIKHIFEEGRDVSVKVSFYEILNEQVFDLINPSKQRVPLAVRELPNQGLFKIVQLTEILVRDRTEALSLLEQGSSLRSTESTNLNQQSSRSHAVFTLNITSDNDQGFLVTRKLNLVDLAGSESVRRTQATGDRFSEGVSINKSLLNLGNVIRALTEKKIHVPYRDSVLTKVLKECLQSTAFITMVACISPTGVDMQETINTLRFANKAKELITKPVPSFLLESRGNSAAKKRRFGDLIPQTPGATWNNTIHTPTPSKVARKNDTKRQLNLTIGTPGKRSKGEAPAGATFMTPQHFRTTATSTLLKRNQEPSSPESPTFSNLSGVSMIRHPDDDDFTTEDNVNQPDGPDDTTKLESKTFSMQDMSSVISPYMRKLTESITGELRRIQSQHLQTTRRDETPKAKSRPRMTSSPVRSTKKALLDNIHFSEDIPAILVTEGLSPPSESIISGSRAPLSQITNKRLQTVMDSASPILGKTNPPIPTYDSPPSTAGAPLPSSPTIEQMEQAMGIAPDSPGVLFCVPGALAPPRGSRQSRRSSRRTTMAGTELETTLKFIRDSASSRRLSNRPTRAAAIGVFYGSPNKENPKKNTDKGESEFMHPLLNKDAFQIDPARQREHNRSILTLLNTGNLKLLTALPAIGSKTGLIIHGYRQLNGGIQNLQELEHINGLGPKFLAKFLARNQIILDA